MQLDAPHFDLYQSKAPELIEAVDTIELKTPSGESSPCLIMRRDPKTDHCVKFENGLCGIQSNYGAGFLGDACYFYPRATKKFGTLNIMSATFSCPQIVREAMKEDAFDWQLSTHSRLPVEIKQYLPDNVSEEAAFQIIKQFCNLALNDAVTPERALSYVISVGRSLSALPFKDWEAAVPFYLRTAEARLQKPATDENDHVKLASIMVALFVSSRKRMPRLQETLSTMEEALNISIDHIQFQVMLKEGATTPNILNTDKFTSLISPWLKRYLAAELLLYAFPFGGLGQNLEEKTLIIATRFATVKLALLSHLHVYGKKDAEAHFVRIVQSLSRLLDHTADPSFSLAAYRDAGWSSEARLRGLIGDTT